jgi:hypothetical protein
MRGTLIILLAATCMLWLSSPVQARMSRACSYEQNASKELHCGKKHLHRAVTLMRFLRTHPYAGTRFIRDRLWADGTGLKRYALSHIRHAQQKMIPLIPHERQWECIHQYEGSWSDTGDPYWGGLQMDRSFISSYGWDFIKRFGGYANVWPVWAQMQAAERAYRSRGFAPWPNTARMCGLL